MVCPKCGTPIKRFDLAPNCKNCGVHILYYTQEADLAHDAKKCELEFAKGRNLVARIKQAYIKGALPISRLCLVLLNIVALIIPFGKATLNAGFASVDFSVDGIGIYKLYSSLGLDNILNLYKCGIARDAFMALAAEYVTLVLVLLADLAIIVSFLLTFLNLKRGTKAIGVCAAIEAAFALIAVIVCGIAAGKANAYEYISASFGFGGIVALAFAIALFVVNRLILKNCCEYSISDYDKERLELAKKIKAGEIKLDDLPLPVVNEPEKEEAPKEEKKKKSKKKDKGDEKK